MMNIKKYAMKPYKLEVNDSCLEALNIDLSDLKNTSLQNLDTSLQIQKQVIKHTSDGIIIGFYIKSKNASLGLTKKVNSLYKNPAVLPKISEGTSTRKKVHKEPTYIFIKNGKKLVKVRLDSIVYAHTDSKNYCSIITSDNKKLVVRHSISSLLKALDNTFFVQTHRSYIINWNKIESLHEYDQTIEILGHHVPIGRTYKEHVYKRLKVI